MSDHPTDPPAAGPAGGDTGVDADAEPTAGAGQARAAGHPDRRPSWWRWELLAFLELFALCGFVFAQPVLDITSSSPQFFLFHGAESGDILVMLAVFVLGPPLALWGLAALTRLAGPRVRTVSQLLLLGSLFVLLAIEAGKPLSSLRGVALGLIAVAAAAAMLVIYLRLRVARSVLRMAAVGPLVFALLFVFVSPVSSVVLASGDRSTATARTTGEHPPVVLVLLDEFPLVSMLGPDGKVDAERYPNFAALAGDATWYRNGTAISNFTAYAVPAMLTGRYPTEKVAPHYVEFPDNLFTLLGQEYEVNAFESITKLCPPYQCGAEQSSTTSGGLGGVLRESATLLSEVVSPYDSDRDPFATYREPTLQERGDGGLTEQERRELNDGPTFRFDRIGDNQPARFHDFIQRLRPAGQPTLHFLHLLMPHGPLQYLSSGMRYKIPSGVGTWADTPPEGGQAWRDWWLDLSWQRHLQQAEYADLLLGETLRVMRESGLYDDALLMVTSDHGMSFTPGASGRGIDPSERSTAELMWVPVFVKEPGQTDGAIDDRNWEHVDLLPTLADYAGFEVPWEVEGIPLSERRERTSKYFHIDASVRHEVTAPPQFERALSGQLPELPPHPLPELVGQQVGDRPVTDGGPSVAVQNLADFDNVQLDSGTVPALVAGTLSEAVPEGTLIGLAVNGRFGTVVPAVVNDDGVHQFAGLIADAELFTDGANQLEVFIVADGGARLQRLPLA